MSEDLDNPEEPTCVINMLNEFKRSNANHPVQTHSFPFVFERANNIPNVTNQTDDSALSLKKRKINESSLDSEKSVSDSLENVPSSPWENNKLRKELIEIKAENKNLEYRFHELLGIKKNSDILYEKDRESFKYNEEKHLRQIQELEKKLKQVRLRYVKLEEELEKLRMEAPETIHQLDKENNSLQAQKIILNNRITQLEEDLRQEQTNRKLLEEEYQTRLGVLEDEKKMNEAMLEKLKMDSKEKNVLLQKQEMYKTKLMVAQQKVQELQLENDNNNAKIKQIDLLESKLLNYTNILKENETLSQQVTNLRQLVSNNLLLEGQLDEYRMQQKKAFENEKELIQLRTDHASLQDDLNQWKNLARNYFPNKNDDTSNTDKFLIVELRDFIEKNQRNILQLTFEKKEIQNELDIAKNKMLDLSRTIESQSLKEAKAKNLLEAHASTIRRLKKQNNLVTWERNDLRQMVDSFQKEVTLIGAAAFNETPPNVDKTKIEVLEKVIEGYRQRMEHIEADQALVCIVPDDHQPSSSLSNEEVKKLKTEKETLLKEKEELMKREKELLEKIEHLNYQMEWRALKGDFDIRETKVLKLNLNQHKESTSTETQLNNLKIENENLKEKIKLLKEQISIGELNQSKIGNLTQIAENNVVSNLNAKEEELIGKIKSLELQGKRLREVYKASSQEFRETVYLLFGYKVDRSNNMYTLSSMYADHAEETLLFQSTSGQLNLMETQYSKTLKSMMDLHLGRYHSIPMFLSALTQDLFQKQTFSMTNSTISE